MLIPDERPGLAALPQTIEADEVGVIHIVHIASSSRDQTLIDGLEVAAVYSPSNDQLGNR